VKLSNQIETRGGLDADKHIQKEVGESPRVWQKPLLSLGPVSAAQSNSQQFSYFRRTTVHKACRKNERKR
jgi:hypothetical protein